MVDGEKVKGDPRLPFGRPGVNKQEKVSDGNDLWISHLYSYLDETGCSGFVMSSQASSAGRVERDVRRKNIETGAVDAMIAIRSNLFYTCSVPCERWLFDRGKLAALPDKVLMLDARNSCRKCTRKIYDFSPEQLQNPTTMPLENFGGAPQVFPGKTFEALGIGLLWVPRKWSLKAEFARFKIRFHALDRNPAAMELLCHGPCRVRSRKGVQDKVSLCSQELDKEFW